MLYVERMFLIYTPIPPSSQPVFLKKVSYSYKNYKLFYKTAEEQLKQGSINGYDFRLTQLSLLNSELSLMQYQFTLKAIEVNLNRLSGKVLETYI